MSWFLIAGTIVDMVERYDTLSKDAKYLLKQYIQAAERQFFERSQREGACRAASNMGRMLVEVMPGKKIGYCWQCGTVEFHSDERTLEDMGWLKNFKVMYSGYLCPSCQKKDYNRKFFLNGDRDIDAIIENIAKYGVFKANRTKDEVKARLRTIYDGGNPYGGAPGTLP